MTTLRVMTYNIWDVPFIATARKPRMKALADALRSCEYDVIGLEEAWSPQTRHILRTAAAEAGLVHTHTFVAGGDLPGGASGGGLLVLSRYPIVNGQYFRFPANGQPYRLHHFDYQAGKGVGFVMIRTPAGFVDLFISHFISQYTYNNDDQYLAHRVSQALYTANIINMASRSPLALLVGDFNSHVGSLEYQLITSFTGMTDLFHSLHPDEEGATCNVVGTPLSEVSERDMPAAAAQANERLDLILYRATTAWAPQACAVTFKENCVNAGGRMLPMSDHYAVEGRFHAPQPTAHPAPGSSMSTAAQKKLLTDVQALLRTGVTDSQRQRTRDFRFSMFLLLLCGVVQWWFAEDIGLRNVAAGGCCAGLACSTVVLIFTLVMHGTHTTLVPLGVVVMLLSTIALIVQTLWVEGIWAVVGMATMIALPVGIAFSTFTLLTDTEELNGMKTAVQTANALLQGLVQ